MRYEYIIEKAAYKELLQEFVSLYLREYGEVELKNISEKVHSSSSVVKFLKMTAQEKKLPKSGDFLSLIHSIYHFTFAKSEKIALASIVALCKWQREVAIPNSIEDQRHLNRTLFDIVEACSKYKIQISNTINLYDKFQSIIQEKFPDALEVLNGTQSAINNADLILQIAIRKSYDDSFLYFLDNYFHIDDFEYLSDEEISKYNKQIFESALICLATIGVVIDGDKLKKAKYLDSYKKFMGVKFHELSVNSKYSEIFHTTDFGIVMDVFSRIDFYTQEIKSTIESKIYKIPYGVLYYFLLKPGQYYYGPEYTELEEARLINSIENNELSFDEEEVVAQIESVFKIVNVILK
jgi:hypothetical protein